MIGKRREKRRVEELLEEHLGSVEECLRALVTMIGYYLEGDERFKEESLKVHTTEGKADDLRRKVEAEIHAGALMPIYRGDYLKMVDIIDKIADKAESVADLLTLTSPSIPQNIKEDIRAIGEALITPFEHLKETFRWLKEDMSRVHDEARMVDKEEGKIDHLEWQLVKKIYRTEELELAAKNLLRELVCRIADISDWIQDASDAIELTSAVRKI